MDARESGALKERNETLKETLENIRRQMSMLDKYKKSVIQGKHERKGHVVHRKREKFVPCFVGGTRFPNEI